MSAARVQRRLAAILAADVVGYSRLMRVDEEGTHAAYNAHRAELIEPSIGEHRGRIVKSTGDGLLAEFASVVDAVRCALAMQSGMSERNAKVPEDRRLDFRVGVNVGDVIVEDEDVFGDGVNVAARLESLAEPGGVLISASAYEQVRDKLDIGFEDLGEHRVKNLDRPVRAYRLAAEASAAGAGRGRGRQEARPGKRLAIGALAAVVVVAVTASAWWLQPWAVMVSPSAELPGARFADRPSIAVLPVNNLSGDASEDYLSDGLTEDIINALGRYKPLAVMAYNAVIPYRNQALQPAQVRRDLGVKYLLEGSMRRAGNRLRISARLTDAASGIVLWSEQFDDEKDDLFAVQDAITRRIAGQLIANLRQEELNRASAMPTNSLDAYDLVLRGRALITLATRRGNREAREFFERAIALDPSYAGAYAWLSRAHYQMATDGWTEFPAETLARAEELASKALELAPELVEAHRTLGRVYAIQFQLDRAMRHIDQAVALNPSDAEAHGDRGQVMLWTGRLEEAAAAFDIAFSYDPSLRGDYVFARGLTLYSLRRHEDAIAVLERGALRYKSYALIPAVLVAAYGQIGRIDEARRNAERVKDLMPFFDPVVFGARFADEALYDYLAEGLRKGGLL